MNRSKIGFIAMCRVMDEREEQIRVHGFTPEKDDVYEFNTLSNAAACYLLTPLITDELVSSGLIEPRLWPFKSELWKPSPDDRKKELIKAAALIMAEIEKIDRQELNNSLNLKK